MVKTFVFFINTNTQLKNEQLLFLYYAKCLSHITGNNVYFINKPHDPDIDFCRQNNISFVNIDGCNYRKFEEPVFIVPFDFLYDFVAHTKSLKNAKIFVYNYYKYSINRLANQMYAKTFAKVKAFSDVVNLLSKTKSCAYKNYSAFLQTKKFSKQNISQTYLPNVVFNVESSFDFSIDQADNRVEEELRYDKNITKEEELLVNTEDTVQKDTDIPQTCTISQKKLTERIDVVNEKEINIGWFGLLASDKEFRMFQNILDSLHLMNTKKRINVHILSFNMSMWDVDYRKYSPKFKFIFTGNLKDEDLIEYIKEKTDVVFSYGDYATIIGYAGVPVVIPVDSTKKGLKNCGVYLCDCKTYDFYLDETTYWDNKYKIYKIEKIINQIYEQNKKRFLAGLCYNFCIKKLCFENATKRILYLISNSSLNLFELRKCTTMKLQGRDFSKYKRRHGKNKTYEDFCLHVKLRNELETNGLNSYIRSKKYIKKQKAKEKKLLKIRSLLRSGNSKFLKVQRSFNKKIDNIRAIAKSGNKIKVAFVVVFGSVFPTRPIFDKMLMDDQFDPYIIIVPTISRTYKYQMITYMDTKQKLTELYPTRIIDGYDPQNDCYLELGDEYSIMFFCNPYKELVHPYHHVEYFLDKNVLPIYSSYGFAALKFWDEVISTDFYNYMWKVSLETQSNLNYLKQIEKIHGKNGVVTGYIKMDSFGLVNPLPKTRKKILICPHHTVWGWKNLNISNFLKYADFFIELPKRFQDIDFIFRPHPLLLANLKLHKVWTQKQIDEYLEKLLSNSNMTYDTSGDYMQVFADSDAMIHDCGSFIGEYLYTKKPCCYMMKSEEETMNGLVPLGQDCMQQYYHAFNEKDIIDFIQNVVINGNDPLKKQREAFADNELMVNFPHAADKFIEHIKKELKIKH